jgi:hypothetical protein
MTLKHILELSGRVEKLPQAISCPTAQSLFKEIPFDRDCDDACIPTYYCACDGFKPIEKNEFKPVTKMMKFTIVHMNEELKKKAIKDGKALCFKIVFKEFIKAHKSQLYNVGTEQEHSNYLISFRTTGTDGIFETTVGSYQNNSKFVVSGDISRIDSYGVQSYCVENIDDVLLKYCNCVIPKPK